MKAKNLEELLLQLNLSPEERAQHAELIKECQDREKGILACRQQSEEGLEIISGSIQSFASILEAVGRSFQQVNDRLFEVLLRRIPESKLPRA